MRWNRGSLATHFFDFELYTDGTNDSKEVQKLQKYMELAVILNFLVDFLLLLGTNRLCGFPPAAARAALAASLSALLTAGGFSPGLQFLQSFLWRMSAIGSMSSVAFGWNMGALRRGMVFALLHMALGGIANGIGGKTVWSLAGAGLLLFILCFLGFSGGAVGKKFIPVELSYGTCRIRILALQDTGNTLRDPITGRPVLVVGAEVAGQLTGLTAQQLRSPVESMGLIPGLRLVPYRTVGQGQGLMLALKLPDVKIGNMHGSSLVAFAPECLDEEGNFQALTGGYV